MRRLNTSFQCIPISILAVDNNLSPSPHPLSSLSIYLPYHQDAAESRDMAAAIGDNLHDAGFDDATVAPADAEVGRKQQCSVLLT